MSTGSLADTDTMTTASFDPRQSGCRFRAATGRRPSRVRVLGLVRLKESMGR